MVNYDQNLVDGYNINKTNGMMHIIETIFHCILNERINQTHNKGTYKDNSHITIYRFGSYVWIHSFN